MVRDDKRKGKRVSYGSSLWTGVCFAPGGIRRGCPIKRQFQRQEVECDRVEIRDDCGLERGWQRPRGHTRSFVDEIDPCSGVSSGCGGKAHEPTFRQ